jgi:PadR family transcriptional regulator
MSENDKYKADLLASWEETYKKGQLTFWMLLAIRDQALYVSEIKDFIVSSTNGTISCEDQSIYRALRKYYDLEIVDYKLKQGYKGPDRKYYFLTGIGKELLSEFTERNISILYNEKLSELITNKNPLKSTK